MPSRFQTNNIKQNNKEVEENINSQIMSKQRSSMKSFIYYGLTINPLTPEFFFRQFLL